MSVGPFQVFDETIEAMGKGTLGDLTATSLTAVLLDASYSADLSNHAAFADISGNQITGGTYAPLNITGAVYNDITGGFNFDTADISWGLNATIPDCRYLAIVVGDSTSLAPSNLVIGFQDLITEGGSVSATNGEFTVQAPAGGWFEVTRS
ncbi:hypothetical protein [Kordiimonas sp. SCSIO 12610]|uniref:hypothetical protein n=1 Tax=Kordiimonas sp. SCSIO 12610 TaxID=2829597 RepID=UPI00210B4235|nr:hypothetical protein [Kordiimonas sp. SCSIO 12610]UTW56182.1 hypothetical protein KFF44_04600 [Kordiimonas sp. SCSIO 12610]